MKPAAQAPGGGELFGDLPIKQVAKEPFPIKLFSTSPVHGATHKAIKFFMDTLPARFWSEERRHCIMGGGAGLGHALPHSFTLGMQKSMSKVYVVTNRTSQLGDVLGFIKQAFNAAGDTMLPGIKFTTITCYRDARFMRSRDNLIGEQLGMMMTLGDFSGGEIRFNAPDDVLRFPYDMPADKTLDLRNKIALVDLNWYRTTSDAFRTRSAGHHYTFIAYVRKDIMKLRSDDPSVLLLRAYNFEMYANSLIFRRLANKIGLNMHGPNHHEDHTISDVDRMASRAEDLLRLFEFWGDTELIKSLRDGIGMLRDNFGPNERNGTGTSMLDAAFEFQSRLSAAEALWATRCKISKRTIATVNVDKPPTDGGDGDDPDSSEKPKKRSRGAWSTSKAKGYEIVRI